MSVMHFPSSFNTAAFLLVSGSGTSGLVSGILIKGIGLCITELISLWEKSVGLPVLPSCCCYHLPIAS